MFHKGRWTAAFIKVSGKDSEAALACLKALLPPVWAACGKSLFGLGASRRLERVLRESANAPSPSLDMAMEYAIRFLTLLVEKNCFRYIEAVLQEIESSLDRQKGIFAAVVETAVPLDKGFEESLKAGIITKTGATGVKMKIRLVPELIGGFRLHIGGSLVDASVKGQLERMTTDLEAASVAPAHGGGV